MSASIDDPGWDGTTVLRGGERLASQIDDLRARDGADIVLTGSISLARQLLAMDAVDELRLFVYPVVIGAGRRLFSLEHDLRDLTLVENRAFTGGVVLLRYARDDTRADASTT